MKKITLLLFAIIVSSFTWAQCDPGEGGQWPSSTITVDSDGASTTINACNYSSEFSLVDGVIAGNDYEVSITLSGVDLYVTVVNSDDDSVIGHGASPYTFTAPAGVTGVQLNWSEDSECTYSELGCRTTTIQDLTAAVNACPEPSDFEVSSITSETAELSWTDEGISTVDYSVEVYLAGESAADANTPIFSDSNVVDTMVSVTGLSESMDYDAYIIANCSGTTTNSEFVGPESFTTTASCSVVTDLDIDNLLPNSVDVTFTPGTGNDSFLVEIYLEDESAANGDTPIYTNAAVTASPESITGLVEETAYDTYVTGFCGTTATDVTGPDSFTTPGIPPVNNECIDAIVLTESDDTCNNVISGTTENAYASTEDTCSTTNKDVWYSFTPSETNIFNIDVTETSDTGFSSTYVSVFEGACGALTQLGTGCYSTAYSGELTAETTYFVNVRSTSLTAYVTFDLCATVAPAPPVNDEIENAIAITVDEGFCDGTNTNANNTSASGSGLGIGSCFSGSSAASDVWFTFTVPADVASIDVSTDFTGGTLTDTELAVYSGTPGNLTEIGCSQDDGEVLLSNGWSYNSLIEDLSVTVGETYYVQVDGYSTQTGTFCLDISTNQTLGINNFESETAFTYYPNPVKNTLTLNAQNTIEQVAMYNMLGQEVLRTMPNSVDSDLDMSNLQTGTYFVKVTIANVTETIRVIKQ